MCKKQVFVSSNESTLFHKRISLKRASYLYVENEKLTWPSCHCIFLLTFLMLISIEKKYLRPNQIKINNVVNVYLKVCCLEMVRHCLSHQEVTDGQRLFESSGSWRWSDVV